MSSQTLQTMVRTIPDSVGMALAAENPSAPITQPWAMYANAAGWSFALAESA